MLGPQQRSSRGFINFIFTVVVIVLILSFLKVNLRGYIDADSDTALRANISLIVNTGKIIWTDYIKHPINTIWQGYVVPFVSGDFLSGLKQKQIEQTTLPQE